MHPKILPIKKSIIKRSSILSLIVVSFVFVIGGSFNPPSWETQIQRLISPQMLIQPEKVASLYEKMDERVRRDPEKMFEFIESEIEYKTDLFNHAAVNHLATAEEVLASGKDDCDGRAVLLCSVLRYAEYNAYTVIGPSHAWVEVKTDEGLISIDYGRERWFVRFDEYYTEWDFGPLFLFLAEEFLLLTVFFSILIYSYERGFLVYVQEFVGYFQYVLVLVVISLIFVVIMSTYWVPGVLALSVSALVIMEILARLHKS